MPQKHLSLELPLKITFKAVDEILFRLGSTIGKKHLLNSLYIKYEPNIKS